MRITVGLTKKQLAAQVRKGKNAMRKEQMKRRKEMREEWRERRTRGIV